MPSYWRCIPCGSTSNIAALCWSCGRKREDATDAARWDRFFTVDAVIVVEATCEDCDEPIEGPFTFHIGCCSHNGDIDLAMSDIDPARELSDAGICPDCGAGVYLEHDEDRVYWEVMS